MASFDSLICGCFKKQKEKGTKYKAEDENKNDKDDNKGNETAPPVETTSPGVPSFGDEPLFFGDSIVRSAVNSSGVRKKQYLISNSLTNEKWHVESPKDSASIEVKSVNTQWHVWCGSEFTYMFGLKDEKSSKKYLYVCASKKKLKLRSGDEPTQDFPADDDRVFRHSGQTSTSAV